MATAHSEATEETVERLFATPASTLDPELPAVPFGSWFDEKIPKRSGKIFEIRQCSSVNADSNPTACLAMDVEIISRHRRLHLEFEQDSLAFRGGALSASELDGEFALESLAKLPDLLRRGMRPFPLTCPSNTELKLRESYAGLFEWCEDGGGTRQGPARAWFSTGIYLLHRGQYTDGTKTGDWIECDRFERCAFNTYKGGVKQ
ncbi:MAG: hypothetical protein HKN28_07550 [Alphaproteobacteria bacterium]|nr:hypothetical protein [Alphaproteobacteria bacterium]